MAGVGGIIGAETMVRGVTALKKMLFIMNPYAGQRKAAKNLAQILEIFNRGGYAVTVYMTAGPGDGEKAAREMAADHDLVVCCGGDGTFNETVAGMLASGVDRPVGYIAAGSTNDFASSLGLALDNLQAARDVVEGEPWEVDAGMFGDRFFSYVASFGAFTRASYATPQSLKNALGHTAYILGGIAEITQLKTENVRIELPDGTVLDGPFIFGAVSNSTSVAGILTISADRVDMCDGKLEVMLVRAPKNLTEVGELITALQKQTYNCNMMTFLSTERVLVTADESMAWTLDGERQEGVSQVEIRCAHKAIRIMRRRAEA